MANIYDMADTWDDGATTFTAIKMNVTDTASDASSLLMDLQVGGVSKFSVNKIGAIIFENNSRVVELFTNYLTFFSGGKEALRFDPSGNARFGNRSLSFHSNFGGGSILMKRSATGSLQISPGSVIDQRNGTNAQTFNLYASYTDASNYTRGALKASSGLVNIEGESAGTGDANIDVQLTPKGTGRVRFGTHAAVTTETLTGYIIIKDSGGTERKVAVVS